MKPSEYLFNEAINSVGNRKKDFYLGLLEYNEFGENISTYKFNRKQEKELDKRFIDREELLSWLKLELEEVEAENIRYGKRNIKDKLCDGASFALRDVIAKIISSNTEEFVTNRNKSKKEILKLLEE